MVSVIIPTYNAEETIERCLKSVLEQTYQDIEIICCDDCSTDRTYEILLKWENQHKQIKIFKNPENKRAAYTRNQCIETSEGEYIAQIDDDDYMTKDRIQKQLEFLENHPEIDFVGTGSYYFDENGVWGKTQNEELRIVPKETFLHGSGFMNPTMMYRANVVHTVGGYRVSKETRRGQDYDMHMRMYAAGFVGAVMPEKLTYYYRGKKSYLKCKYQYRIDEAKIRYHNFRALGLMPKGSIFVFRPLIVGLIPIRLLEKVKRIKRKNK